MLQFEGTVESNKELSPHHFHIILKAPDIKNFPGQFVMVKVTDTLVPLLRRPMAVLKWRSERLEMVYRVVGGGTVGLMQRVPGDKVGIVGPLGNSFEIPPSLRHAYIVAGGVGMVPLFALAEALNSKKIKTTLLFGGNSRDELVMLDEFEKLGVDVRCATMDGEVGKKGFVTLLLEEVFAGSKPNSKEDIVYACGPGIMMRKVFEISDSFKIPSQVSLEARMACGTGICLGCVTKIHDKNADVYKRVCKEGPIFWGHEVCWDELI